MLWYLAEARLRMGGSELRRSEGASRRSYPRRRVRLRRIGLGGWPGCLPINASFDVAILSSILPFVHDSRLFLDSLKKISKELIVRETRYDRDFTVPLMRSLGLSHRTDPTARREYTRDGLVRELAEAGWTVKECLDTYDIYVWAVRDTESSVTGSDRPRGRQPAVDLFRERIFPQ